MTQETKLKKAWCEDCGYIIRVTKKWIDFSAPICPACKKKMRHELEGVETVDPRQTNFLEGKQ